MSLKQHSEVVEHNGKRIQQSSSNLGHVSLVITIVENLDGTDCLTMTADTQDEVDQHWAAAVKQYGPPEDDGA